MAKHTDRLVAMIFGIRKLFHEQVLQKKKKSASALQFVTLQQIKEKKPLMHELAGYLDVTPPSATSLVATLAKAGLVRRVADEKDRRSVQLKITPKGDKYLVGSLKEREKVMRKNLSVLNNTEQKKLAELLTKIITANK